MDLHEFYKNHYFFELSRKDQLARAVTLPAGLITLVGGAIVAIVNTIDSPFNGLEKTELILLGIATLSLFVSVYFLARSYFNYGYGYIATSFEIMEYKKELELFYKDDLSADIDSEIEEYVNEQYVIHTNMNTRNNDRKSSFIHKANWALISSLALIILAGIPHIIKSAIDSDQVYKVQIIKKGNNHMTDDKKDSGSKSKPQQPTSDSVKKTKPTPPQGRVVLEDHTPPIKDLKHLIEKND